MTEITDAVLERAAYGVWYEMEMLLQAERAQKERPTEFQRILFFEAYLLHFRNLLEFFFAIKPRKDDVTIAHYVDPKVWSPMRPDWSGEYRNRCNKLLAHLTFARVELADEGKMGWVGMDEKTQFLRTVWDEFMDQLPAERRGWFAHHGV